MVAWLIPALISAAASVGSNVLHNKAANKVAKEQALRESLERARQDQMRSRAQTSFSDLLATQTKDSQLADQAAETAKLEDAYVGGTNKDSFLEMLPGQGDASNTVKTDIVNSGNRGIADALSRAKSRALLESFGRVGLSNDIKFQNTNQGLNDISRESFASANILPMELKAAENKGANLRGWANLLSTVGDISGSIAGGSAMKTAMTPGPFGGESSLMTIGNKSITPSLDVWSAGPSPGIYGPAVQKSSLWDLLRGK